MTQAGSSARARAKPDGPVLTTRALNRALLARQLLLERAEVSLPEAVERIGGLQAQYAPSAYVGLWTRVAGFRRDDLTRALEDRSLIQATLMRTTIHVVSRREYWRFVAGVRRARQEWARRTTGLPPEDELPAASARLREALRDGPRTVKELGEAAKGFIGALGYWVDLVRVPPSGTWERRRADRLALAEDWVGPDDSTEDEGLEHLVRSYLRAFGPAGWKDIAGWAGIPVEDAKRGAANLTLVSYRDERGGALVDLPDMPLPDPDTPAPVRFLPHWDANLLVHARRTGLLPEEHRPKVFSIKDPFSVGTVLVDGRVVAGWSVRDDRVVLDEFEPIPGGVRRAVEREREALEAFHA
ncbi:MAG TPA: winged helix DNA-binding domain-containing protein [Candidatus Binatia bacterium]|nr:winged helix DNA-binding domain-containing protein [Candidatus Binatia bacterium]